jgi:hypothetical protein
MFDEVLVEIDGKIGKSIAGEGNPALMPSETRGKSSAVSERAE